MSSSVRLCSSNAYRTALLIISERIVGIVVMVSIFGIVGIVGIVGTVVIVGVGLALGVALTLIGADIGGIEMRT